MTIRLFQRVSKHPVKIVVMVSLTIQDLATFSLLSFFFETNLFFSSPTGENFIGAERNCIRWLIITLARTRKKVLEQHRKTICHRERIGEQHSVRQRTKIFQTKIFLLLLLPQYGQHHLVDGFVALGSQKKKLRKVKNFMFL